MRNVAEDATGLFDNQLIEAARPHYDPEHRLPREQLGAFLVAHYDLDETSSSLPELITTIAADTVTTGTRTPHGLRLMAGNSHEREWINYGVTAARQQADAQARSILANVPDGLPRWRRALVAADRLAWKAHGTTLRKSGKNAYEHPAEVAALALTGLELVEDTGRMMDRQTKEITIASTLLHDTFEDTERHIGPPLDAEQTGITPLLIQRTLQLAGVHYGAQAATTVRYLTRAEGGLPAVAKPWQRSYASYTLHGRQDPGFCLVKPADAIHNSNHDPKPTPTPEATIKWHGKQADYGWLVKVVREQAAMQAGTPGWAEWLPDYIDALESTTPGEMPEYLNRLEAFMGHSLSIERADEVRLQPVAA